MASNEGKAFKYVVWLGKLENMSVFDSQGETSSIKVKKGTVLKCKCVSLRFESPTCQIIVTN